MTFQRHWSLKSRDAATAGSGRLEASASMRCCDGRPPGHHSRESRSGERRTIFPLASDFDSRLADRDTRMSCRSVRRTDVWHYGPTRSERQFNLARFVGGTKMQSVLQGAKGFLFDPSLYHLEQQGDWAKGLSGELCTVETLPSHRARAEFPLHEEIWSRCRRRNKCRTQSCGLRAGHEISCRTQGAMDVSLHVERRPHEHRCWSARLRRMIDTRCLRARPSQDPNTSHLHVARARGGKALRMAG